MRYTLYTARLSRSLMVEMVLAETGAPYTVRPLDMLAGEHRGDAYLAVNPTGWVPCLVTPEGAVLYETPAINLFLAERHGADLVPAPDAADRGAFLSAFFNITGEVEPALKRAFFAHRYQSAPETVEAARALGWNHVAARLRPIESRLAGQGPFLLGARFSLADLTLAYWMPYVVRQGLDGEFPSIMRLYHAVRARPALTGHYETLDAWVNRLR